MRLSVGGASSSIQTNATMPLKQLSLTFQAHDYTIQNAAFCRWTFRTVQVLEEEFESEGNDCIPASLIRESKTELLPFTEAVTQARYLYHIQA